MDADGCLPARSAHGRNDNLSVKRNSPFRYLDLEEYDLRLSGLGLPGKKMHTPNTFHADFSRGLSTARLGTVCPLALIVIASKLFVPNSKFYKPDRTRCSIAKPSQRAEP